MQLNSYFNMQASASFGIGGPGFSSGVGFNQLNALLQQLMSALQMTGGFRSPQGCRMASPHANFGGQPFCGQPFGNPGLSNFCGGFNQPNVNINIGGGFPQQNCGPMPQHCGPMPQPQHCHGPFGNQQPQGCNRGGGQIQQEGKGKPISYTTSGGYQVTVNKHDISIKDPNGNEVKHHGDPHENLNGKHLKDWEGKQRTVVLGDGTKITMTADGPHGVTQQTSIYDRNQNVQIANAKNEIEHASRNIFDTMRREQTQHDGEASVFTYNRQGDAMYYNVYNQAENGMVTRNFDWLGMVDGSSKKVTDMYDDKRLGHT